MLYGRLERWRSRSVAVRQPSQAIRHAPSSAHLCQQERGKQRPLRSKVGPPLTKLTVTSMYCFPAAEKESMAGMNVGKFRGKGGWSACRQSNWKGPTLIASPKRDFQSVLEHDQPFFMLHVQVNFSLSRIGSLPCRPAFTTTRRMQSLRWARRLLHRLHRLRGMA